MIGKLPDYAQNPDAIKAVLSKMGFTVLCLPNSTTFKLGSFRYRAAHPLHKVDLTLLLIYYADHIVIERAGGPTNGWS